jgi:hypothetical protein
MSIPEKIYIRKDSDFTDELGELWESSRTWDDDVEYIRADLLPDLQVIDLMIDLFKVVDRWQKINYRNEYRNEDARNLAVLEVDWAYEKLRDFIELSEASKEETK